MAVAIIDTLECDSFRRDVIIVAEFGLLRLRRGQLLCRNSSKMSAVYLGPYTLRDLDVAALADGFNTATSTGRASLVARLSAPTTESDVLEKRQAQLAAVRERCRDPKVKVRVRELRRVLHDTEEAVRSVADAHDDKRHAEYYNQLLWDSKSPVARLNTHGWFTELVVFFRTLFLPGMSLVMPLSILIMPFLVFHYVLKRPMTAADYFDMIAKAIKKAMPSALGAPRFAGSGGLVAAGEQFVHLAVGLAIFVASIWNQISAARSLRRVVADIRQRADSVRRLTEAVRELGELIGEPRAVPIWPIGGDLSIFGVCWNQPEVVRGLLADMGELDMLVAVSLRGRTAPVTWSAGETLRLTDLYHPGTGAVRVMNSVTMGPERSHVLLTGPNRGGKSTMLKSLGAAVLMAQTVGVVFARAAVMPRFDSIITALAPGDVIGRMSLFEAEIEFAKDVRARVRQGGRMFLMMDEIFHGTNAHDGVEASQIFLDDLYESTGTCYSVVSTHYMDLPKRYEGRTQNLCMDASIDPVDPDRLIYTYRLREGVNGLSSVREILRERGLLEERGLASKKRSASDGKE